MISEFALEPELVATWHDREKFLFFDEKFGPRTGRIVSAFPKRWKHLVWKAFNEGSHGQDQNAKKRFDALLSLLSENMVKRAGAFPEIKVWLERAEAEHAVRPFHAIVATQNPRNHEQIIIADELIENGHNLWQMTDNSPVRRTAAELVTAVAPILRVCRQIVFIDPYFDPTKSRFMKPMDGFLKKIWNNRYCAAEPQVELHTGVDRYSREYERGAERDIKEKRRVCDNLKRNIQSRLPQIIPRGKKMRIFIWKQRELGEKLHNRYILTEVCGVSFGIGLDKADDLETMETDDLQILTPSQLTFRWKKYKGSPAAFDSVAEPFELTGS